MAASNFVSWCEQFSALDHLPIASKAALEVSFIVNSVNRRLVNSFGSDTQDKDSGRKCLLNQLLLTGIGLKHRPQGAAKWDYQFQAGRF